MEFKLSDVLSKLPVKEVIGGKNVMVRRVVALNSGEVSEGDVVWISDKNIENVYSLKNLIIVIGEVFDRTRIEKSNTYLIVDNPRFYFLNLVKEFFVERNEPSISERAIIDRSAIIGEKVTVHPGVIIERNCEIGSGSVIGCNSVIKKGTYIGKNVIIGANNTIGGDGFGYEKDEDGLYEGIPHIGNVIIEDGVEIGNNTAIDRGVLGSTIIRRNAKIDNLVHIAHGVEVGENSLIIANSMIAGSVSIGKNVWVAPSASILNKKRIGDDAVVGMGAVVLRDVDRHQTVVGNPARDILKKKENLQ